MDQTAYVDFFRQTSPYIHSHRGKTFVIALSGDAVLEQNFHNIIHDIALLQSIGIRIVVVHGAKPQIDARLLQANIESLFERNVRITDASAMHVIKEAVGSTRFAIEAEFSTGLPNSPMHGSQIPVVGGNVIMAKPLGVQDGVDFQLTGQVRRVNAVTIDQHLSLDCVVLLSPIGFSPTGEAFNLSYQDVATNVAISLNAEKLIYISKNSGISDGNSLLRSLSLPQVAELQETTKDLEHAELLSAASHACEGGVERVHLVGYQQDGTLLTELFTRDGSGTLITNQCIEIIRSASIDDVGGILQLITPLEEKAILVKRSRELLENEICQFIVVVHPEGLIIGCAALYPTTDERVGELACVAIHEEFHSQGIGARLLNQIEQNAASAGIENLLVMTTKTAHWFIERGFSEANIQDLPANKQSMYNYQRNARIFRKPI